MKLRTDVELTVPHTDADYEKLYNTISFKPEESWNFELGTHLNLFGDALHLDLSTFYMLIRNQQLSVMTSLYGYGRMMVNAGKSYSCGLEASLRGKAFDNRLSYQLGYGYTHAAFKVYETGEGDSYVSYKGKRVPFVPEHTISALADYTIATNSPVLRAIVVGANVSAMGKIYWDEANTFSQKLYAVLGAHVDADFGKVKLSLWGRNITNSKYNTFAFMSRATGEPVYSAQRGNPFQMGATCNIHF
jgi:outer membrane receptor protein involved in Fe transport